MQTNFFFFICYRHALDDNVFTVLVQIRTLRLCLDEHTYGFHQQFLFMLAFRRLVGRQLAFT